jgi:signal transduction histidine kinase
MRSLERSDYWIFEESTMQPTQPLPISRPRRLLKTALGLAIGGVVAVAIGWLIRRLAEQTRELQTANRQLRQEISARREVEQAAAAANQVKSEFLANMSHELRTPLNSILGYAQILKGDPSLTPTQLEEIRIIQQNGEHLLTLLNDILDLSKVEAGRLGLELAEFHLPTFLKNLVSLFQMRANQKGLAFHYEQLTPLPAGLRADERKLRQVLINLLGNAIKFTEAGQVTFRVCRLPTQRPTTGQPPVDALVYPDRNEAADILRFEIQDSGPGIPPRQLNAIFEPFRQVRQPGRYIEGPGLGLSISRRLAGLMGAALHVESQPGQGSRFWLDLPLPKTTLWPEMLLPPKKRSPATAAPPKKFWS